MIGGGDDEASILPVVHPHRLVSVYSLGSFLSVCPTSKPSHYSFPLSIGVRHIQEYSNKKKVKTKNSYIHIRRRPGTRSAVSQ